MWALFTGYRRSAGEGQAKGFGTSEEQLTKAICKGFVEMRLDDRYGNEDEIHKTVVLPYKGSRARIGRPHRHFHPRGMVADGDACLRGNVRQSRKWTRRGTAAAAVGQRIRRNAATLVRL